MADRDDVFDLERIRALIDLMEERGLAEVDLKRKDQQIRLVRSGQVASIAPAVPTVAAESSTGQLSGREAGEAILKSSDGPHIKVISAPMVGTYYDKPNPNAEPFVKIGSKVSADTVVCIVEAMKVFNEIPAEVKGTIVEVLANNEDPVDFGRPLFKVDTRG